MRNRHAGEPFTTSDADITAALKDLSVPALLLSCVHMSGDASLLDGPLRPAGIFLRSRASCRRPTKPARASSLST